MLAVALLRGTGSAAMKSEPLLPASMQPLLRRCTDRMADGAGARVAPSKQFGVVP
jgi:hypothetical protein